MIVISQNNVTEFYSFEKYSRFLITYVYCICEELITA